MSMKDVRRLNDATPQEWDTASKSLDPQPYDNVERPKHYTVGPVEVIDIIGQQLGTAIEFHYEGNALKYLLRWRYKNGVEDLRKARWNLERLIKEQVQGDLNGE